MEILRRKMGKLTPRSYSFAHAQFVWDCKAEPKVREIFAKIWGTDKLTVSYGTYKALHSRSEERSLTLVDGGTLAFPTPDEPDHGQTPWPHVNETQQTCIPRILTWI